MFDISMWSGRLREGEHVLVDRESALSISVRRKSIVVTAILILILLFAFGACYLCWLNDFSDELRDVLFPVVGALFLSLYLGLKATMIDAPKSVDFNIPIASMHDWSKGTLKSMYSYELLGRSPEAGQQFLGIKDLDTVFLYVAFENLNLHQKLVTSSTNELRSTELTKLNIMEFLVFDWMSRHAVFGSSFSEPSYGLSGYGQGGAMLPQSDCETIAIPSDQNELIAASPIKIRFPKGTTQRLQGDGAIRTYFFESSNFEMQIRIVQDIGGVFNPSINPLSQKVNLALGVPSDPEKNWFDVFRMQAEFRLKPLRRFSKQSALAAEWFGRLQSQLAKDFSWDLLRTSYQKKSD